MYDVSQQFLDSVPRPHRVSTILTCTPPGGDTVTLPFSACSVTAKSGTGTRKTASVTFTPVEDLDLFELVTTPGAIFNINHGFRYGPNNQELVPLLTGEPSSGVSPLIDGSAQMSLTDRWTRVERCRYVSPYTPPPGLRSKTIADTMEDALGPLPRDTTPSGGSQIGVSTWDRDRTQAIKDLATDGSLEAYVDSDGAEGIITVRQQPVLDPTNVVWTIRSGDGGTLTGGSRTRPLDRLYNVVVVVPQDDTQTWARQISNPLPASHPRHPSKIGVVPYFWSSPTITSANAARSAANTLLARVLGTTETLNLSAVSNPALQPGDVIQVIRSGPIGQRLAVTHIIDGWVIDCVTGGMTADTRATVDALEA